MESLIHLAAARVAHGQNELLLLYVMLSFAATLAGCDTLQTVLSVLGHGFWSPLKKINGKRYSGLICPVGSQSMLRSPWAHVSYASRVFTPSIISECGFTWNLCLVPSLWATFGLS